MVTVVKIEPHPTVVNEAICKGCGATLEYVPNEVQTYNWIDYGGDNNVVKYVTCPNCNNEVKVKIL
jgi:ribosomal protein S27E